MTEPLRAPEPARVRTPAEEARALVAAHASGLLATLTADGDPWGSLVAYGTLPDGAPVLHVSTLAEHGRNLARDGRASLVVAEDAAGGDPLDAGRVTLAGRAERPAGAAADAARSAFLAAVPGAERYADFADFTLYVLRVQRVRWVGGFARMDSIGADAYRAAEPDPVAGSAASAVRHLNDDHADALLAMAAGPGGFTDATAASCVGADRYGLDLWVETPRGAGPCRVGFARAVHAGRRPPRRDRRAGAPRATLGVAGAGMPVAGPRREHEQQPGVADRADGMALAGIEDRGEPRPAGRAGELDLALDHDDVGALVHLVLGELLARLEHDGDRARGAALGMQDPRLARLDVERSQVPELHGREPTPAGGRAHGSMRSASAQMP